MSQKDKFLEEYNKYKHIIIETGIYEIKNTLIKYEVTEVNEEKNIVTMKCIKSSNIRTKTLHWCRKNLTKFEPKTQ